MLKSGLLFPWLLVAAFLLPAAPAAAQTSDARIYYIADGSGSAPPFTAGPADDYPHQVTTSGLTDVISAVRVRFGQFEHGNPDDLNILMVGPNGNAVVLLSDAGESSPLGDGLTLTARQSLTFDDAGQPAPDGPGLAEGTWRPTNHFGGLGEPVEDIFPGAPAAPRKATLREAFAGSNPNGTWSFYVVDDRPGATGSWINPATVEITTAPAASGLPPVALSAADAADAAGNRVTADIDLRRFDGFTGPVTLSLADDPRITDVTFTPNPVTSDHAQVSFKIRPDAAIGVKDLVVQADPAGDTARRVLAPLRLHVRAPFVLETNGRPLRSCDNQPGSGVVKVVPDPQYTGPPITLTVDTPADVTVDAGSDLTSSARRDHTLFIDDARTDHGAPFELPVRLSAAGYPTVERRLQVADARIRIIEFGFFIFGDASAFYPLRPGPGYVGVPGSHAEFRAENLCPGAKVEFGAASATVEAPLSLDGTTVADVPLPVNAVRGPIVVTAPGRFAATADGDRIRTFRDRHGWAFENERHRYTEASIRDTFVDETEPDGTLKPWAKQMVGDLNNGTCLGMAILTMRNAIGTSPPGRIGRKALVFEESASGGSTPVQQAALLRNHIVQISDQWAAAKDKLGAGATTAAAYAARVKQRLATGEPVLIEIWQRGSGHALSAYRIRDRAEGGWSIDVADPNIPFDATLPSSEPSNMVQSTLTLLTDGSWAYPGGGLNWAGNMPELHALPIKAIPKPGNLTFGDAKARSGAFFATTGTRLLDASRTPAAVRQPELDASANGVTSWRLPRSRVWTAKVPKGGIAGFAGQGWSASAGGGRVRIDQRNETISAAGHIEVSTKHGDVSRVASVRAPAGATVGFGPKDGELVLVGRGRAVVTLEQHTKKGARKGTVRVRLGRGTTRLRPSSWRNPGRSRIRVRR